MNKKSRKPEFRHIMLTKMLFTEQQIMLLVYIGKSIKSVAQKLPLRTFPRQTFAMLLCKSGGENALECVAERRRKRVAQQSRDTQ